MTSTNENGPRLYVGTYGKYNNGSIAGAWLDLADYADKESFLEACKELHKDESDPELMFQDFEGFPRALYSESSVDERLFDFAALDDDDRELLAVFWDNVRDDGDIDDAREAYAGTFDTKAAWAEEFLEDAGGLSEVPDSLRNYIDFESWARDAELGGDVTFVRHEGELWVFWNNR